MKNRDQALPITILKAARIACAFAVTAMASVAFADSNDRVVTIVEELSIKQIVERELQSDRFARQIATYNGIETLTTILPVGTSLRIPTPYFLNRDFGRVVFVKGDVVHTQKDLVVNPPVKGAYVFNGDVFTTGEDGFVSLNFNSGTSVSLQPDSRVAVVNIDCVDDTEKCVIALKAEKGELSSEIAERPAGQPKVEFSVKTPFLSAAVRGTAFYTSVDELANRIGVTRGTVAADSNGSTNEVPEGKGMLAKASEVPNVVDLLEPPVLTNISDDTLYSEEDLVNWQALDAAAKYRFSIWTDPKMSELVVARETESTAAAPNIDAAGKYFLSVAGIDEQDFLGMPAFSSFVFASIDDEESVELSIERVGNLAEVSTPGYKQAVELQLSNSIGGPVVIRRLVDDLSQGISLELESDVDWVFKVRKILGESSVSRYGNEYVLEAAR